MSISLFSIHMPRFLHIKYFYYKKEFKASFHNYTFPSSYYPIFFLLLILSLSKGDSIITVSTSSPTILLFTHCSLNLTLRTPLKLFCQICILLPNCQNQWIIFNLHHIQFIHSLWLCCYGLCPPLWNSFLAFKISIYLFFSYLSVHF